MKKPLITLFILSILCLCMLILFRFLVPRSILPISILSLIYMWIPGFVALYFARKENIQLPLFKKPNKTFYLIFCYSFAIAIFVFLLSIPFGGLDGINPAFLNQPVSKIIGLVVLLFFTSYVLTTVLFSFLYFGGELFWRGYCLAKLSERGLFKAIWITATIFAIWMCLWGAFFFYTPGIDSLLIKLFIMILLPFSISPLLTYFRLKCQSILASSVFYGSAISAMMYFFVLFPRIPILCFNFIFLGFVLLSLLFKLYSPATWEKFDKLP